MWERLYELVTGQSAWTSHSVAKEFGETPATRYADVLKGLTDWEVVMYGDRLIEAARRRESVGASR